MAKKSKSIWLVASCLAISIVSVGMLIAQQKSRGNYKLPPKIYVGKPAIVSDLLIESANASSINLMGRWKVESINNISVAPAVDWLEKPAIAHINFEVRDGEVLLKVILAAMDLVEQRMFLTEHYKYQN